MLDKKIIIKNDIVVGYEDRQAYEVVIPEGVKGIKKGSFANMKNLCRITFPTTLEFIESGSFYQSWHLTEIVNKSKLGLKENNYLSTELDANARYITKDDNDSKLEIIDDFVIFTDNGLRVLVNYLGKKREIITPKGIDIIGKNAFYRNTLKFKIELSEGVKEIEYYAFEGSNITEIILPKSLEDVNPKAFNCCYILKKITIKNKNTFFWTDSFDHNYEISDVYYYGQKVDWDSSDLHSMIPKDANIHFINE